MALLSVSAKPVGRVRQSGLGQKRPSTRKRAGQIAQLSQAAFTCQAALLDIAVIAVCAFLSGLAYQRGLGPYDTFGSGLAAGLLFVTVNLVRQHYAIHQYLTLKGHTERALMSWVMAFGAALALGFMTKTTATYSRGAVIIFFVTGFAAVMLARNALIQHMRPKAEAGQVVSRTIVLVGGERDILAFMERHRPSAYGLKVIGAPVLRAGPEFLQEDLALAVAMTRILRPNDVFLLLPWSDQALIARSVDLFRCLPAAIHLGAADVLERFHDMRIDRTGPISSVHLVRRPILPMEILAKRIFDLVVSSLMLVGLSPLFALTALALRLDSPGPIFFKQRRYGFNQEPFRIIKFRSMSTMEDSANLVQATVGDKRITRVGAFLRRTNIDELPQLINVLKGDMSLIGPRPHALAHDQQFERTIALYARRHNVRPGITGWAQVNGWRGETDTAEKILGRVEHDLYYIDNWSMLLDVSILLRTVFSPRAFKNAR